MCVHFHIVGTVYNYNICDGGGGYDFRYQHNALYLPLLLYYVIGGQLALNTPSHYLGFHP